MIKNERAEEKKEEKKKNKVQPSGLEMKKLDGLFEELRLNGDFLRFDTGVRN